MMSKFLKKHPVVKTMLAYFFINSAADINEQIFIKGHRRYNYDAGKTVRIGLTGCFVIAPLIYNWIKFIDRFFPGKNAISVIKKVAVDVAFFAPVALSSFFIATSILEGKKTFKDVTEEWEQKFFKTWTTGMMYWPIIQTINFAFVPTHLKTSVYMPTASFLWMNFLCFMKDKPVIHHQHPDSVEDNPVSPDTLPVSSTVSSPVGLLSTANSTTGRVMPPESTSTRITSPVSLQKTGTPTSQSPGTV